MTALSAGVHASERGPDPASAPGHHLVAPNTRLAALTEAGVAIWLDSLSRDMIETGELDGLVHYWGVTGATTNPAIFAAAITGSNRYDRQLAELVADGETDPLELFFSLALEDVRAAADCLRPVFDATGGTDGFVSFECTPDLAGDAAATVRQARDLWHRIDRPNAMIKVPATVAGIDAFATLIAEGINANVTLLFSAARYSEILDAYQSGLEHRLNKGRSLRHVASAASIFVSRLDKKADAVLLAGSPLRGEVAIANAAAAFVLHRDALAASRWRRLASAGAHPQKLLWASTAPKDPTYRDVMYVERLIAPGTINTMPPDTLRAFADHGRTALTLAAAAPTAWTTLAGAARAGVDVNAIADELEREGIESFAAALAETLQCLRDRARAV